ncbi:hypothetical protein [Streptomyces sp. enrichment culture]|uniref:hypothetical protein n=1 Tax=Streptomyces sp. enrichment culture TaxID=1795815 RepID=UPI003F547E6E
MDGQCCVCGVTREQLAAQESKSDYIRCRCGHFQMNHHPSTEGGCQAHTCACDSFKLPPQEAPEPPLTPEEEEEAPEDDEWHCALCNSTDAYFDRSVCAEPCGGSHTRCGDCGAADGGCLNEQPPPQPERRAPYVATYSVGGHLYEVAVPGDACLQAVDGALVIRHGLGPVAALVGFQPLTVEERA